MLAEGRSNENVFTISGINNARVAFQEIGQLLIGSFKSAWCNRGGTTAGVEKSVYAALWYLETVYHRCSFLSGRPIAGHCDVCACGLVIVESTFYGAITCYEQARAALQVPAPIALAAAVE